ncbi:MAG: ATP synthase F0 subunit B [Oscillospiraceae bacterium]|nr:ATP synthase F0 subunit B [Oscillospiraceae bacterium]
MPLNIDFLQILLHMLNFVILAGGLTFLLFKPVNRFLEQRREQFVQTEKKNLEDAEKNEQLRVQYEQKLRDADTEIAEKKKSAEKECADVSAQYIKEAREKAARIILKAENEAEERKGHILQSAQAEIGELVVSATQKLLSDTANPERDSALYDEFIRLAGDSAARERANNDKK